MRLVAVVLFCVVVIASAFIEPPAFIVYHQNEAGFGTGSILFGNETVTSLIANGTQSTLDAHLQFTESVEAANIIATSRIIDVGPTHPLKDIHDVLKWLRGRLLLARVTFRFAPNVYLIPNILISDLLNPRYVQFIGDPSDASQVVFQQIEPGDFITLSGPGAEGIEFSGFTFIGLSRAQDSVLVIERSASMVVLNLGTPFMFDPTAHATPGLILRNARYGARVEQRGRIKAMWALRIESVQTGVYGNSGGVAEITGSVIDGGTTLPLGEPALLSESGASIQCDSCFYSNWNRIGTCSLGSVLFEECGLTPPTLCTRTGIVLISLCCGYDWIDPSTNLARPHFCLA